MTRKHFKMIAATVANISNEKIRKQVAEQFAQELKAYNINFKKDRFLEACNVKQ